MLDRTWESIIDACIATHTLRVVPSTFGSADTKVPLGGTKNISKHNRRGAALETGDHRYYAWRYRILGASRFKSTPY